MYFTLEHKGERKLVTDSSDSSLSHVSQIAFPGSEPSNVAVIAATRKKKVALDAMSQARPSTCIGGNPSVRFDADE